MGPGQTLVLVLDLQSSQEHWGVSTLQKTQRERGVVCATCGRPSTVCRYTDRLSHQTVDTDCELLNPSRVPFTFTFNLLLTICVLHLVRCIYLFFFMDFVWIFAEEIAYNSCFSVSLTLLTKINLSPISDLNNIFNLSIKFSICLHREQRNPRPHHHHHHLKLVTDMTFYVPVYLLSQNIIQSSKTDM